MCLISLISYIGLQLYILSFDCSVFVDFDILSFDFTLYYIRLWFYLYNIKKIHSYNVDKPIILHWGRKKGFLSTLYVLFSKVANDCLSKIYHTFGWFVK